MKVFSLHHRAQIIQSIIAKSHDLIVIGGGITGAGIALDAQSRGIGTVLFEMQDFAAGTSSRSTKLIHGGLRYLKQFELKLVAEVGRERAIVYRNGLHLTTSERMLLPLLKNGSIGRLGAWLGLAFYDRVANVKKTERRKLLSKESVLKREPLLDSESLIGGALYYEYRTDDARLTIEVLKEAVNRGTEALNYVKVTGFLYQDAKVCGVKIEDLITHEEYEVKAKHVVNATGPWVDNVDGLDDRKNSKKLILTKGVHIVVDQQKLPINYAMYFDTPDGRMIFTIPRGEKVYIGTTDTEYTGNLESPLITLEDRQYLIDIINATFTQTHLSLSDIESGWAGLRPLIKSNNASNPGAISRKDEVFQFDSGLITIAGGKLTGYRKMAERVVDLIATEFRKSGQAVPNCTTETIRLSGGAFETEQEFRAFALLQVRVGKELGLSEKVAKELVSRYGSNVKTLYSIMHRSEAEAQTFGMPLDLLAQLKFCLEFESVLSPSDFFIRRTGDLYFNIAYVHQWKHAVAQYLQQYHQWDSTTTSMHLSELDLHLLEATEMH